MNDFRSELEKSLRAVLSDAEWEMLQQEGYADDPAENAVASAAGAIRSRRAVYAGFGRRKKAASTISAEAAKDSTVRQRAISVSVWLRAQMDSELKTFRDRVLEGQLLSPDQGPEALEERLGEAEARGKQAERSAYRRIYQLGAEAKSVHLQSSLYDEEFAQIVPNVQFKLDTVAFARRWFTALTERLANDFGWSLQQAQWFIATNDCPYVPEVMVEARICDDPLASKLVLTIDPTTDPDKVAAVYTKARAEIRGRKFHSQSDKHALLGFFTWQPPGHSPQWERLLEDWNELVSDEEGWPYARMNQFRRDAAAAQARLYRPSYLPVTDASGYIYMDLDGTSVTNRS